MEPVTTRRRLKFSTRIRIHRGTWLALLILLLPTPGGAEILKLAIQGDAGVQFYWWPILPRVAGWYHDRDNSLFYGTNAQAPEGSSFTDAETVIYAKAIFKDKVPQIGDVDDLVGNDKALYQSEGNVRVTEVEPLFTANGEAFPSCVFSPQGKGNWEQVAYAEEGEFFLLFTLSSRSRAGFEQARDDFRAFIRGYRR